MWSENHFTTSEDGQIWYLSVDNDTGCGFQRKQRYRFGWFSMKLKLVGGDSVGVVTAYYRDSSGGASVKFLGEPKFNLLYILLFHNSCKKHRLVQWLRSVD